MSNINNSKIEIEEVESANKLYLLFGMVYAILFVILEFVSIREFFVSSNTGESIRDICRCTITRNNSISRCKCINK